MSFHTPPPKESHTHGLPTYAASDLTAGGDISQIVLDGQGSTLRITRANKLILTK